MNEEDFFDRFKRILNWMKELYSLDNLHDALIVWYAENALFLDPEETVERIVTDKHGEGVDAFLVDENNSKLIFVHLYLFRLKPWIILIILKIIYQKMILRRPWKGLDF